MDANWRDKPAEFFLMWYSSEPGGDGELVGKEKIPSLTEAQFREWFYLQEDEYFDGEIVRASQMRYLQKLVDHSIDLNRYDYFVEHLIDNE